MHVLPYLYFHGRCEEALGFYQQAVGAQVTALMRFDEAPEPPPPGMLPAGFDKKVMHAEFKIGDTTLFASDGMSPEQQTFSGISLTLALNDEAEVARYYAALGQGGKAQMPPAKTFFALSFGTLVDRFGVEWLLIAQAPQS